MRCLYAAAKTLVDVLAGFAGHAELAGAEAGFYVFGSVAREGDFEVVDERGAVHGDAGDEAALHEIDEDRTEADFDDVATDAPKDGGALAARTMNRGEQMTEVVGCEKLWERIKKLRDGRIGGGRLGEVADAYFAFAGRERIGMYGTERERLRGIDAH
jgi:hypothetical protein